MALIASSVARICKGLAQYLGDEFSGGDTLVKVVIGSPADAAPAESDSDHKLNLFFFRFEPSGFDADTLPGETGFLRMHCLATPFGILEEGVSSGENDLRIIGEVLRIFHEKPVFELQAEGESFHVQVMFQTLGLDQINQLWSTQGDTVYRPSALFEVSLAPVIPRDRHVPGPLTGALGLDVRGKLDAEAGAVAAVAPMPAALRPDTRREDWSPALALVYEGQLAQSLSFEVGSTALNDFTPDAWVAGELGTQVDLVWDIWDGVDGWRRYPGTTTVQIEERALAPDAVDDATLHSQPLPFTDQAGQMVLYAERTYTRGSDGHTLKVRSNPVLINLYEVGS